MKVRYCGHCAEPIDPESLSDFSTTNYSKGKQTFRYKIECHKCHKYLVQEESNKK